MPSSGPSWVSGCVLMVAGGIDIRVSYSGGRGGGGREMIHVEPRPLGGWGYAALPGN